MGAASGGWSAVGMGAAGEYVRYQSERNRRMFQNKNRQPREVAFLCKEDFDQFGMATASEDGVSS